MIYERVAFGDAFVEPFLDLLKQPHDPVLAEPNPLGKLPGGFEPRDMLGRIGNATDRSQLLLRYDLLGIHRTTPLEGSVDAPVAKAAPVGTATVRFSVPRVDETLRICCFSGLILRAYVPVG